MVRVKSTLSLVPFVLYSHTNTSGNIIKHNLRNSMNERTHFFIKIYISHMFLWCVRDGWRDIYSERWLLFPISSSRSQGEPTLAPPCKLIRDASGRLRVPRSTAILSTLSKSHCVVLITWSSSVYSPVRPECPDRAVLFTNQNVTACQAHGVTRNEPKIHGICYITHWGKLFSFPNDICIGKIKFKKLSFGLVLPCGF